MGKTQTMSFVDKESGVEITFDLQEHLFKEGGVETNHIALAGVDIKSRGNEKSIKDDKAIEEAATSYFEAHPEELKLPGYAKGNKNIIARKYMEIKATEYLKQRQEQGLSTDMEKAYLQQISSREDIRNVMKTDSIIAGRKVENFKNKNDSQAIQAAPHNTIVTVHKLPEPRKDMER